MSLGLATFGYLSDAGGNDDVPPAPPTTGEATVIPPASPLGTAVDE